MGLIKQPFGERLLERSGEGAGLRLPRASLMRFSRA